MKALVIGTAGFIGMHVSLELIERGDGVIGVDNLNDYYDPKLKNARFSQLALHAEFKFELLDIADCPSMSTLFRKEKFDRMVHIAGHAVVRYSFKNPYAYVDSNLVGFVNILEDKVH
jgi:UDP-glucuronate 4-epimerase